MRGVNGTPPPPEVMLSAARVLARAAIRIAQEDAEQAQQDMPQAA